MNDTNSIAAIAARGIETIPQTPDLQNGEDLQTALSAAVSAPACIAATRKAETAFARLAQTTPQNDKAALCRFLHGWQNAHLTALYVSAMTTRLLREATQAAENGNHAKSALLFRAAAHSAEISVEDVGLHGLAHGLLFERLATGIIGDDSWKLSAHAVPECVEFRRYVEQARLKAPLETALLTTAASENWNTGEYTHAAPVIHNWLESLGFSRQDATKLNAYVKVHAGDTELHHFTHALIAWQLYCEANGIEANPKQAAGVFSEYAQRAGKAYEALAVTLSPQPAPATEQDRALSARFNREPA